MNTDDTLPETEAPPQVDPVSEGGASSDSPAAHARYLDLFERLIDTALLVNPDSEAIIDANTAAERTLGEAKEELIKEDVKIWVAEEDREKLSQAMRIAKRRYYPRQVRVWMTAKNPERKFPAELAICALDLDDGKHIVQIIAKDMTREYEAEQAAAKYLAQLEALSTTDEMTQLANFRHFKRKLTEEHERAVRYGTRYSLIFCDVDNFKHYNDRNGHPAGDEVLRGLARILKEVTRKTDLPARYGGEEFVILCPETDGPGAMELAQRILDEFGKAPIAHAEAQPLKKMSFSGGVAAFPEDAKTAEDLLHHADEAVYFSKRSGRARVTRVGTFTPIPPSEEEKKKSER
jgi:diguanylate cyclase (GGDEF)-like protein/PAS domain S-box-containing protein